MGSTFDSSNSKDPKENNREASSMLTRATETVDYLKGLFEASFLIEVWDSIILYFRYWIITTPLSNTTNMNHSSLFHHSLHIRESSSKLTCLWMIFQFAEFCEMLLQFFCSRKNFNPNRISQLVWNDVITIIPAALTWIPI